MLNVFSKCAAQNLVYHPAGGQMHNRGAVSLISIIPISIARARTYQSKYAIYGHIYMFITTKNIYPKLYLGHESFCKMI